MQHFHIRPLSCPKFLDPGSHDDTESTFNLRGCSISSLCLTLISGVKLDTTHATANSTSGLPIPLSDDVIVCAAACIDRVLCGMLESLTCTLVTYVVSNR